MPVRIHTIRRPPLDRRLVTVGQPAFYPHVHSTPPEKLIGVDLLFFQWNVSNPTGGLRYAQIQLVDETDFELIRSAVFPITPGATFLTLGSYFIPDTYTPGTFSWKLRMLEGAGTPDTDITNGGHLVNIKLVLVRSPTEIVPDIAGPSIT